MAGTVGSTSSNTHVGGVPRKKGWKPLHLYFKRIYSIYAILVYIYSFLSSLCVTKLQERQQKTSWILIMHAVVKMVLCVTGTFHPRLVASELCVAVVRKNNKQIRSTNVYVALQDVSLRRVRRYSSLASSSSHISTRLLSLPPLFVLMEADCKPTRG